MLRNLPERLNNETFAKVRALAESATRPLPAIDREALAERMRMMFTLPHQRSGDGSTSELKAASYEMVLGHMPLPHIDWMVRQVMKTCEWLPPPAKCLTIAEGWHRSDDAVLARREAAKRAHNETMARSVECNAARRRMEYGGVEQADIEAMPPWVVGYLLKVRELVRCEDCGSLAPARRSKPEQIAEETDLRVILDRIEDAQRQGDMFIQGATT